MADPSGESEDNFYSPQEMKDWLRVEATLVRLAAKRRLHEAAAFVDAYADGGLSRAEANRLLQEHEDKWGDAARNAGLASELHDEAVSKVYRMRRYAVRDPGPDDRSR